MTNSDEDALKQYYNSLIELNQNSKPFISMLTILAGENMSIADGIVDLIIDRIFNVGQNIKLWCLYLIDSICKNVGEDYIELFSKNLVAVFYHIYEKGDYVTREKLFRIRKTWKGIFQDEILEKLDSEIYKKSNKLNQLNELPNQSQLSNQKILRASISDYVNNNKKRQLIGQRSPSPEHKRSPNWNNQLNSNNFNLNNNNNRFKSTSSNNLTSSIRNFNFNNIPATNSNIQSISIIQAPIQSSFQQQQQFIPSHQILQPSNLSNFLNHQMITDNSIPGLNNNIFNPTQSNLNNINLPSHLNQFANSNNPDIGYRFFNNNRIHNQPTKTTARNLALNPQAPEELKLQVDGKIRKLYYLDHHSAIVLMNCMPDLSFDKLKYIKPHELDPRSICFEGPPVNVIIDENNCISLPFNNQWKIFYYNNCRQKIKFGGPVKEIYLNNQIIQAKFGGTPVLCKLIGDFNDHTLRLGLPAPKVKLSDRTCEELWLEFLKKYAPQQMNNLNNNFNLNTKPTHYQPLIQPRALPPPAAKFKKNKKDKNFKEKDKTTDEPELTLDSASLKIRRQSLIDLMYSGSQCTNCSLRFDNTTEKGKLNYSAHLDWHFRQNRKVRDSNFRTSTRNRDWYLPGDLWLKYKEINMEEENENSKQPTIFELNNPINDQIDIPLIKANIDDKLNICSICYEKFSQRWCDDEEEWKLVNAELNEDKYYHPSCLNDMLNKSINEEEVSAKDDETMKSEETITSDSMLQNYEPSIVKEDADEKEIKADEIKLNEEKENNENNENNARDNESEIENEKDNTNDEIKSIKDTDSRIDANNLVKKTVLNIRDDQMEDEQIKLDNEESDENKTDTDLKEEIIDLNNSKKDNESTENDNNEIVKKIKLISNTKKEIKQILVKLKDSNLELINQRNKELNSPTSDRSKSPISQDEADNDYNYLEDPDVSILGREESALCSIM